MEKWERDGMVLKERTRIPTQSSVPVLVQVQEWPESTVTKGGCAAASVESTRYPVGGNDGLIFFKDDGNAYMMMDNILTLRREAYIGAVERVQDIEELVLEEKDAPRETPPQGECADKENVKMLKDIVGEQVKQLPPELQNENNNLIVSNHYVLGYQKGGKLWFPNKIMYMRLAENFKRSLYCSLESAFKLCI